MAGRDRVDPELARLVEQRLEDLLAERDPRQALPSDRAAGPPARRVTDAAVHQPADLAGRLEFGSDDAVTIRRWPFTRAHLAVVGVIATIGILIAGWAVLRSRPVPLSVAAVAAPQTSAATPQPTAPAASSASATARASPAGLVVHVVGAVRRPGLVRLAAGARVQDAVNEAGGLRPGADLGDLNLAQLLADGQQVIVGWRPAPNAGRTPAPKAGSGTAADADPGTTTSRGGRSEVRGGSSPGSAGGERAGPDPQLDLNTATVTELEVLPGVGPVTAAKIVAWRQEHGRFSRIEELQEVTGIGPKTYAEIAPHCRV